MLRYELFRENYAYIQRRNAEYDGVNMTYTLGINKFADWTREERQSIKGMRKVQKVRKNTEVIHVDYGVLP
jgi:TnpA family transposase